MTIYKTTVTSALLNTLLIQTHDRGLPGDKRPGGGNDHFRVTAVTERLSWSAGTSGFPV